MLNAIPSDDLCSGPAVHGDGQRVPRPPRVQDRRENPARSLHQVRFEVFSLHQVGFEFSRQSTKVIIQGSDRGEPAAGVCPGEREHVGRHHGQPHRALL